MISSNGIIVCNTHTMWIRPTNFTNWLLPETRKKTELISKKKNRRRHRHHASLIHQFHLQYLSFTSIRCISYTCCTLFFCILTQYTVCNNVFRFYFRLFWIGRACVHASSYFNYPCIYIYIYICIHRPTTQ